ncbi:MAG: MFS transporter [Clostridia bacterium]|nr:MFS transporter [Clostridia bacterium]
MGRLDTLKDKYFPQDAGYSRREQLGYCGGIFGNSMGQDIATTYSDIFARKYLKIEAPNITLFDNVVLAVGGLAGSLAGYILDTPAKPKKLTPAKRITGIMPIPVALAAMLMFVVPTNDPTRNFIWKAIFHLIFTVTDTFYDSALNAMSLRIATDQKDRKTFFTVGTLASSLGSMVPGWIISPLVGSTKDVGVQKSIYFIASLVFCILGTVSMFVPFFTLNEKIRLTQRPEKEKLVWDKQTVLAILHNRTFVITEIGSFFEQIRQISYKLLHYLYQDLLQDLRIEAPVGALSGSLAYAGLLLVPSLSKRFTTRTILSGGFAYTGFFYTLMGLLGRKHGIKKMRRHKLLYGLLIGLAGMPNYAISASKKILVGDSTDYMEWYAEKEYGKPIRAEGFISSVQSVLGNVFNWICTNTYDIFFDTFNYKPNITDPETGQDLPVDQTSETLNGIFKLFIWCGMIGNFLAAATYLFENYHGAKKAAVTAELAEIRARRQLAQADVAEVEIP